MTVYSVLPHEDDHFDTNGVAIGTVIRADAEYG